VSDLIEKLRSKLAARGAHGIYGLGRNFKIQDRDNSFTLDRDEFTIAMRNFGLGFTTDQVFTLFQAFDINKSGTIDYDEFLRTISGSMNPLRTLLVN